MDCASARLIRVRFTDSTSLLRCYMPFLRHGGLFIPGDFDLDLSETVVLLITLPEGEENLVASAQVAWIHPDAMPDGKPKGTGFHFLGSQQGILAIVQRARLASEQANLLTLTAASGVE